MRDSDITRGPIPWRRLKRWTAVGAPLLLGLILVGIFVFLLAGLPGTRERPASKVADSWPREGQLIPGPFPEPPPPAKAKMAPLGPGVKRWGMEQVPDGWDEDLARKIAEFFGDLELPDMSDEEKLVALSNARDAFEAFLAKLGPEAIPTLSAILGYEPSSLNRRFLIRTLGSLGPRSEEATYALLDFYDRSSDIYEARPELGRVIEAMGELKNESAYAEISKRIDDPNTQDYFRDKFIKALGEHPRRDQAIPQIVGILHQSSDVQCRNHAAQFLGKTRKPETLDQLISAYEKERAWFVRQTILGSIGKIGDDGALPFLEQVSTAENDSRLRLSAASAIRRIGTAKALRTLRSVLQVERDEKLRGEIESWIEELSARVR